MKENDKTKAHLIRELAETRSRLEALEKREAKRSSDDEQRFRLIVDTAYEGIWVFDEHYVTTFVNRRLADMLGYEPDEMVGKKHESFLFEEDLPDLEDKAAMRRRGVAGWYERRLRRKDGAVLWTHVSASPILDKENCFRGSFAMFTDITEKKKAEHALLESEAKYRNIFENAVEGMFQSTPEGRLMTVNPAMARIFGYASPSEMVSEVSNIGRQLYANTEDRRTFRELLEAKGTVEAFEAQFCRKDGTRLWGSLNVRAVRDPAGVIVYFEGIVDDITARKKAEEALRRSEEKYRNIFENAMEGIFQITEDGRYLSVNPALARIHGFSSPDEMIMSVTDVAHQLYVDPRRRDELRLRLEREGSVKGLEIMMRRKDKALHWVSVSSHAVRDSGGNTLYYEGTVEDITSRKVAEEEREQLRKVLEGTIEALSLTAEVRDPGTRGHQKRVANLAARIAHEMEFPPGVIDNIRTAGMIHDIGKIAVPAEILSKPGKFNEAEFGMVKIHPQVGHDILKDARLPHPVAEIVLQHHERLNGSGYPRGLKGNQILVEARILAVADVVEAMVSPRPYRPAHSTASALHEVKANQGLLYDAGVVAACLRTFGNGFDFGR
ncbi:MAG: Cyclic di-GMP phosphodiesterase response regulator RpfG [Syntrophorhabdaceae bacterium PtaU1.Bin034]|nr:MAG: Cyclic di-GMP phosphodiesterase response regulator RpfG [Syntrophorhabdaceae bacterium PtaU1.Bin034]